jgi:hypothetical protein
MIVWAHQACFDGSRDLAVEADDPRDHGRVPSQARCSFCGDQLPFIGKHPYAFDAGAAYPPERFWAHADCLHERIDPDLVEQLKTAPPLKY